MFLVTLIKCFTVNEVKLIAVVCYSNLNNYKYFNNCITLTGVTIIIMHMKKLLDSDWLRAVQFKKCNTGAKSVTPVQITHCNSG